MDSISEAVNSQSLDVSSKPLRFNRNYISTTLLISLLLFGICGLMISGLGIKVTVSVLAAVIFFLWSLLRPEYRPASIILSTALSASQIGLSLSMLSMGHIVIIIVTVAWVVDGFLRTELKIQQSHILSALILINFLNVLSISKAIELRHWAFSCADFLAASLACFLVGNLIRTPRDIDCTLKVAIYTGLLVAIIGVWQFVGLGIVRVYSIIGLGQYNTFAGYLVSIIPISLAGYFCKKGKKEKTLYFVSSIFLIICLFMTQSRGGVLALFGVLSIIVLRIYKKNIMRILQTFIIAFSIGLTILVVSSAIFPLFVNIIELRIKSFGLHDTAMWSRVQLFYSAINMIKTHPILGIGLGNYLLAYHKYGTLIMPPFIFGSAHNIFLQVLAEQGIIGFVLFYGIIFLTIHNLWIILNKSPGENYDWWCLGLIGSICGVLIHGFVDSIFHQRPFSLLFWSLIGLSYAVHKMASGQRVHIKIF